MTQTESTTRHTPGPWKAQCDCRSYRNRGIFTGDDPDPYGNRNAWGIYGPCRRIARLEEADTQHPQAQVDADARLIVRAVNAHADLLAAAKCALAELEGLTSGTDATEDGDETPVGATMGELRAAIAKAEGE